MKTTCQEHKRDGNVLSMGRKVKIRREYSHIMPIVMVGHYVPRLLELQQEMETLFEGLIPHVKPVVSL